MTRSSGRERGRDSWRHGTSGHVSLDPNFKAIDNMVDVRTSALSDGRACVRLRVRDVIFTI